MDRTEHLTENELALYVDGLRLHHLDAVPGELLNHVQHCFECKRAIMEISAAIPEDVYTEDQPHPSFGPKPARRNLQRRNRVFARLAAGIVLLVGVGTAVFYIASHKQTGGDQTRNVRVREPEVPAPSNSPKSLVESSPLAAAESFKPSPLYDRLAGEKLRSGTGVRHRPANGDTAAMNERFSWEGTKTAGPFTLTVLDNRGRDRVQADLRRQEYRLAKKLAPGLYYWKVEEAGELVFVGKFYVIQ